MVFQTEITHLVSGSNEAQVLDILSQKEFSERQIGKKWIYLERNTLHIEVWAVTEGKSDLEMWCG